MKQFKGAIFALVLSISAVAQMSTDSVWTIESYDWNEVPQKETRPFIISESEAIITNTNLLEIKYNGDGVTLFELIHRRIWVGDEKVIQRYNKLYLPLHDGNAAKTIKARVLLPNGNVVLLDEKDVQEGKDEDDNIYRYFALDGVQVGSIVEYLFLTQEQPSFLGARYTLQRDVPVYDLKFELVVPYNLVYRLKSYNALAQAQEDTVLRLQNRYFIHQDTLPKFKSEEASFDRAYMGYLIYSLQSNLFSGSNNISDFKNSAATVYRNVHTEIDKKTTKSFKKILAESEFKKETEGPLQLARLENYLKENYFLVEGAGDNLSEISDILANHGMSEIGALRFFHAIFDYAGFPNEVVLTSAKSNTPFDPDFENNLMIREDFLFFPTQQVFMSPTDVSSRIDYFDDDFRNTKALFIHGEDLGDGMEGVAAVGEIPALKSDQNKSELIIDWHLGADNEPGEVAVTHILWGMQGVYIQTISKYVPEAEMEKFEKTISASLYSQVEFEENTIENMAGVNFPGKPLTIKSRFKDEVYTEPGSSSTIVKLGDIIGPQTEMYLADSVRYLPVHHGFPRSYDRTISVHVPEGYVLKNLETLEMDYQSEGDAPLMGFVSTYTYEDNLLKIEIEEWYELGDYPVEMFDIYRTVVNAAADFNKKYIVLEKKP